MKQLIQLLKTTRTLKKIRLYSDQIEYKLDDKHTCIQWIANQVNCPILTIGSNQDLKNTISIKQYCQLHPQLLGCYHNIQHSKEQNEPTQIGGICIANLEENWDIQCQIICDLLSNEDGRIGDKFRKVDNHIPLVYFVNSKQLRISIESTYELVYGQVMRNCYEINEQEIQQWSKEIRECSSNE